MVRGKTCGTEISVAMLDPVVISLLTAILLKSACTLKCAHSCCFWNGIAWEKILMTLMNSLPVSTPFARDFEASPIRR